MSGGLHQNKNLRVWDLEHKVSGSRAAAVALLGIFWGVQLPEFQMNAGVIQLAHAASQGYMMLQQLLQLTEDVPYNS